MPEREVSLQGRPPASVLRFPRAADTRAAGTAAPTEPPSDDAACEAPLPDYVELHCVSNFSFLRGAAHPDELAVQALRLGYIGLALTDECSVAGVVRMWDGLRQWRRQVDDDWRKSWREAHPDAPPSAMPEPPPQPPLHLLFGAEFRLSCGARLVAIARDLDGWGGLCQFITAARRIAEKGGYLLPDTADATLLQGCEKLYIPDRPRGAAIDSIAVGAGLAGARARFGADLWLAVELLQEIDDDLWLAALQAAGAQAGIPLVAAGDVHMDVRRKKRLQDVVTAVRAGRTVADCGFALQPNGERHLRPRERLAALYPPELLAATLQVAARCRFDLTQIAYRYPKESVPAGLTPAQGLRRLVEEGVLRRFGGEPKPPVRALIEKELALIAFKQYEMYFLTVEDIVRFARREKILCQGRGSAANSVVCYCLGITEVPPDLGSQLFERFISKERNEPPDIDVDFEHQRREEVIQYIYGKYGRERAAIAAVVVRYRSRMAIRDVGGALGVPAALVDDFAKDHYWFDAAILDQRLEESMARCGVRAPLPLLRQWIDLTAQLRDFPRHLSQHVGGFVLTDGPLTRLVPVENASMPERSIIQWEKNDLEAVGLMKVDVLALGMLSALRRGLAFRNAWRGTDWTLQDIPREQPEVYDMICTADTVGVFQVESRAQMTMLPRLKPREFYDLVVEVAIVRPGPIQGGMVLPYLQARQRQRDGLPIAFVKKELTKALGRTLGVPIFQEQVMQLAMDAAGFTADEADALRRSMAAWKRSAGIYRFKDKLVEGMVARDYDRAYAEAIFNQIEGFGEYGFPESHAASFALLVYFSCWLKCFEPAAFLAGILDAQPMGFYSASQLVQDARRHGVEVRPVDVTASGADSTLETPAHPVHDGDPGSRPPGRPLERLRIVDGPRPPADRGLPACALPGETVWPGSGKVPQPLRLPQPAVRLGLRLVSGLGQEAMDRIVEARAQAPFANVEDLALRARLGDRDLRALAAADALRSLAGHRRQQVWEATAQRRSSALLQGVPIDELPLALPAAPEGEEIVGDYASTGLTLRRHPLALLRDRLARWRLRTARDLAPVAHGTAVRACGIVTMRQRPPTAKGTMFVTLEDETGVVNVIVWKDLVEQQREPLLKARLLAVEGVWQRHPEGGGLVRHLLARRMKDLTPLLGALGTVRSRDFH
ncbi:error-prone DNA polymerase [uncultured Xylophilus sp.]|uniref:error-prone DNA polymerase n=1 Tax=uncultured Xylophilus sp. TaxID=296832 RepID=UPI0025D96CD9|nr:error-prone DNA polymerase [uncultured Xylophilus sp.]